MNEPTFDRPILLGTVLAAAISACVAATASDARAQGCLSQKALPAGCHAVSGNHGCTSARGMIQTTSVSVSPDNANVYTTSEPFTTGNSSIAVFSRDTGNGELTQLAGTFGCISEDGSGGACAVATGFDSAGPSVVSPDGRHVYIADASFFAQDPALVVLDVEARTARRLLAGHPSVVADDYTPVVQGRRMEVFGLVSIRPGVDSIVLDRRGEWLYFAPVTDLNLYRVRTRDLRDASLSAADLAGRVEVHAAKTMSDGLSIDDAGNIYISDLEHSAIVSLRPDRSLETVIADPRLRWPDGFSFGPEGWLYVSCSALHQVIGRLPGQIADAGPFQIYRVWTGQTAWPGH